MREPQHHEGKNKTRRAAKQHVADAAEQKRDAYERLHAFVAFTGNTTRYDRSDRRSNAARREQDADSASRILTNREYLFAEDCEQRQYAAADSPRRFHEQGREHAWPIFDVLDALDGLSNSEQTTNRQLLSFAFLTFRNADARDQHSGQ